MKDTTPLLPTPLVQQIAPSQQVAVNAVNQSMRLGSGREPLAAQSETLG
jgi:P pilus assembly chaperone PapD